MSNKFNGDKIISIKLFMQNPAEKYLIKKIIDFLRQNQEINPAKILNIGAGKSVVIENALIGANLQFTSDRIDVADCQVNHRAVDRAIIGSVESMPEILSANYHLAFANYVIEHIANLENAAQEIYRAVKPGGIFIASLPNPRAPQFLISRFTPLWFHRLIKGRAAGYDACEVHYNYGGINHLIEIFAQAGWRLEDIQYQSFVFGYLHKFPVLNIFSKIYDKIINALKIKWAMWGLFLKNHKNLPFLDT